MSLFLALADAERTRRLRAALPPEQRFESFTEPAALLRRAGETGPPTGLILASLPAGREREHLIVALAHALPGCPRVLWSQDADVHSVASVIEHGRLVRLLGPDVTDDELKQGLLAVCRFCERQALERLEIERLDFAHEVLRESISSLERHVDSARRDAHDVERLISELRGAASLEALVECAAETVAQRLPGRGVHVALEGLAQTGVHEAWSGVRAGKIAARIQLRGLEREFGVIEITSGDAPRESLSAFEEASVWASEAPITLAAQGMIHRIERNDAQLATVYGLARLAEQRDDTTGRHLERVSTYSRMLGEFLRAAGMHSDVLTDRYLEDLELSAPLHDIGKVAVPDAILLKPGKLNEEEWVIMRSHAELGAQALETILEGSGELSYLRMGHAIAWCHHERWDGGGYPRGIAGTDIPLSARIMSLADVYDALTSPRPYKAAWTHERAVEYVSELAGKQFDPDVVRVFVAHAAEFDAMRDELADTLHASVAS